MDIKLSIYCSCNTYWLIQNLSKCLTNFTGTHYDSHESPDSHQSDIPVLPRLYKHVCSNWGWLKLFLLRLYLVPDCSKWAFIIVDHSGNSMTFLSHNYDRILLHVRMPQNACSCIGTVFTTCAYSRLEENSGWYYKKLSDYLPIITYGFTAKWMNVVLVVSESVYLILNYPVLFSFKAAFPSAYLFVSYYINS
jgi:hypothetical protein